MLCYEGKISMAGFFGTAFIILITCGPQLHYNLVPSIWGAVFWGPLLYFLLITMVIRFFSRDLSYQIAIRSAFLGFTSACSILLTIFAPDLWMLFGIYGFFMSFFHYSEFIGIAWSNPHSLSIDSFILNHSVHYAVAACLSWLEFILEALFLPDFKTPYSIWIIGVILCTCGEILRKTAMATAMANFNHVVQYVKAKDHKLVTHGIYSYTRHPSYVGWFWWSIGTQIILMNPICIIVYTIVSWKFFQSRIYIEEITLLNFFGMEYYNYQQKVPTGLPYINGYQLQKTQ